MRHTKQLSKALRSGRKVGILLVVMGALSFYMITVTKDKGRALASGLGLILIGTLFIASSRLTLLLVQRAARKTFDRQPERNLLITYEFTNDHLKRSSELGSSEVLWQAFPRVVRTRDGFLIYPTETQVHWVPVHGFQEAGDVERFAAFAKSKIQDYSQEE